MNQKERNALRKALKTHGIQQTTVAAAAGVSPQTVSLVLSGKSSSAHVISTALALIEAKK